MTEIRSELGHLPKVVRSNIDEYGGLMSRLVGANFRSVTIFGRVLDASFDVGRHPIRSILVVGEVDLQQLRRISEDGVRLGRLGFSAPFVMTPDYIGASRDTFSIELLDIQLKHVTILGDDLFTGLTFDDGHIRLQCERELKTVMIGLRQGLLASAGDKRRLDSVETQVGEGLIRTLRGLLWLRGTKEYLPISGLLDETEKSFERRVPGIRKAIDPNEHHGWDAFQELYRDVEALGAIVDAE